MPHPDDDCIGMAHSIRVHLDAGRPVYVVLFTDGEASGTCATWLANGISGSPAVDLDGDGDKDVNDFALARRAEFSAAMSALGVSSSNLSFRGRANPSGPNLLPDGGTGSMWQFSDGGLSGRYQDVKNVMSWYQSSLGGSHAPSHKTVMRYYDSAAVTGDSYNHSDHWYVSEGLDYKADTYGWDARFYKIYIFQKSTPTYLYREYSTTNDSARIQADRSQLLLDSASFKHGQHADYGVVC